MCTSPIYIRNRAFRFLRVDVPRSFVSVPCGHCDECLARKQADLFIRAKYEYNACLEAKGVGFMCCLTYDDTNVPTFTYQGKRYMVFNKRDVIKYIKRLRMNLVRYFQSNFGTPAPAFKYLITSEFGTDPTRSHRPHYHLLFFFRYNISLPAFRKCFVQALVNRKTGKSYFGRIFQCDVIRPELGGISYSTKYVIKDLTFEIQRKFLENIIHFQVLGVNIRHGLNLTPVTKDDYFRNHCIRSSKAYKVDLCNSVQKYKDMLQFYLVSNDLGVSCVIDRYGESLKAQPFLNSDGIPFGLPRIVVRRFEEVYGTDKANELKKSVFEVMLRTSLQDLEQKGTISCVESMNLQNFFEAHLSYVGGILRFNCDLQDYENLDFFDPSYFMHRQKIYNLVKRLSHESFLKFRSSVAFRKKREEREDYCRKKYNNPSFY